MFKISPIPTPGKVLIGIVLLAVAALGGAWLGSTQTDKSWQLKDTQRIAAERAAKIKADAQKERERQAQASKVTALDAKYQKEINDAQINTEKLLRDARTRAIRLYAKPAKPAALSGESGTASGVDAEARCELDGQTAENLISITSDGDAAIRQLTALQQYVSDVCLNQE